MHVETDAVSCYLPFSDHHRFTIVTLMKSVPFGS
jgi:hypothetical protein